MLIKFQIEMTAGTGENYNKNAILCRYLLTIKILSVYTEFWSIMYY